MKNEKISKFDQPNMTLPKRHTRLGSMDVLNAPSRISDTLFYPDGRIEKTNRKSTSSDERTVIDKQMAKRN